MMTHINCVIWNKLYFLPKTTYLGRSFPAVFQRKQLKFSSENYVLIIFRSGKNIYVKNVNKFQKQTFYAFG